MIGVGALIAGVDVALAGLIAERLATEPHTRLR